MSDQPILSADEFPFDNPMAHELVRLMAVQYTDAMDAIAVAAKHGVDPLDLRRDLSPRNLWREILRRAAVAGGTRSLVQEARDAQPKNPRVPFLDALLADETAPVSAERVADPPRKEVTRKEALLFFDDLTIEIGRVGALVATLQAVATKAPSVCRLRVETATTKSFGTGFRVGKDAILTNEHVLHPDGGRALSIFADFGAETDGAGAMLAPTSRSCDVDSVVADADDDWGIIRVEGLLDDWPIVPLDDAPAPKKNDATYILQHPGGQTKRLGFVRNLITDVNDRSVEYLTDTQPGSSGAPVFDAAGRVIALHYLGGEPVAIAGKGPLSKNEGIRISRVLAGLAARNIVP